MVQIAIGLNLFLVTVRVTRDYQGRTFEATLSQLLYDPSKIGSAAQAQTTGATTGTTGTTTPGSTSP